MKPTITICENGLNYCGPGLPEVVIHPGLAATNVDVVSTFCSQGATHPNTDHDPVFVILALSSSRTRIWVRWPVPRQLIKSSTCHVSSLE
jgi:hypothetical protein